MITWLLGLSLYVLKVDALNRVIGLSKHLDDAYIDIDRLKFVLFRIYNHVRMCRKQNYHCSPYVDSDWTVYNMAMCV